MLFNSLEFLFGFLPRASVAAWALLAAALIIAMFGTLLGLPSWVMDLSPFQQIPEVLVASFDVVPFAAVVAVVVGLTGLGLFGFGRRDVMT